MPVSPEGVTTSTRLSRAPRHQTRIVVRALNRLDGDVSWSVTGNDSPPADCAKREKRRPALARTLVRSCAADVAESDAGSALTIDGSAARTATSPATRS